MSLAAEKICKLTLSAGLKVKLTEQRVHDMANGAFTPIIKAVLCAPLRLSTADEGETIVLVSAAVTRLNVFCSAK